MIASNVTKRLIASGHLSPMEAGNPLVVLLRASAVPLVLLGSRLGVAPNAVTACSILLGVLAAALFAAGHSTAYMFVWTASVLLDYVDGGLARRTGRESYRGYLLDMFGDRLKLGALVVAWALLRGGPTAVLLALLIGTLFLTTEVMLHALISHAVDKPERRWSIWTPLYRMLVEFNMHSFLIYGAVLLVPDGGYTANVWLALALVVALISAGRARLVRDGQLRPQLNRALLARITSRIS